MFNDYYAIIYAHIEFIYIRMYVHTYIMYMVHTCVCICMLHINWHYILYTAITTHYFSTFKVSQSYVHVSKL